MDVRAYMLPLLAIFVIAALFGAFSFMAPMHHEAGCPFMPGQVVLCTTSALDHLRHSQSAFASILANSLLLTLVLIFGYAIGIFAGVEIARERVRMREQISLRPTLMQELFSSGIVHPKPF